MTYTMEQPIGRQRPSFKENIQWSFVSNGQVNGRAKEIRVQETGEGVLLGLEYHTLL